MGTLAESRAEGGRRLGERERRIYRFWCIKCRGGTLNENARANCDPCGEPLPGENFECPPANSFAKRIRSIIEEYQIHPRESGNYFGESSVVFLFAIHQAGFPNVNNAARYVFFIDANVTNYNINVINSDANEFYASFTRTKTTELNR